MKKVLLSILLTLLPLLASAETVEIDGIWYNLVPKAQKAEVTSNPNSEIYSGNIVIPASITYNNRNYSVTSIARSAFKYCNSLSITIPNSIESIGALAFSACFNLASITIPNSVTSIGDSAFESSGLATVKIPNQIKSINKGVFRNCRSLISITIPNSVESISAEAFEGCISLTSIVIPSSVTSIGNEAFEFCESLTSIIIPNSVTSIGERTFKGCCALSSVTIPNCVTSIGKRTFENCSALTSVSIPNSVTYIGPSAFVGCKRLTSVTIGRGVTNIMEYAFEDCDEMTDVYCFAEKITDFNSFNYEGLFTDPKAFNNSYPQYMTLHVPAASIKAYRSMEPWSQFKAIVAIEDGEIPQKCATPEINYVNGKVSLSSETEGVEFISKVTVEDAKDYYDSEFTLSQTYKITVYATKANYENSDVATREIVIENGQTSLFGDLNKDGKVNVADHVKLSDIIMNK